MAKRYGKSTHFVQYVGSFLDLGGAPSNLCESSIQVEVAIHTILKTRQVYPEDLFVKRQKYDAPVFQSRHPALNEYISGAVKAIGEELVLVRSLCET